LAISTNLGYPRIGRDRELKKATEAYWSGKIDQDELGRIAADLRAQAWRKQADAGIQLIPSNDFSFYDHVLDTIALSGAVPQNYEWNGNQVDIDTYFAMARGSVKRDLPALEMTKWFNSNYHYIVPEFWSGMKFSLSSSKPFDEFSEAKALGFNTKPVLVGPVTFLLLGKVREGNVNPLDLLDDLLPVYQQVLEKFQELGAEWVQFDEPAFVSDRSDEERQALTRAYDVLAGSRGSVNLTVQTYFDRAGESYETLVSLPVQAVGLDFVHGREGNLRSISERGFPDDKTLVAGVIDGRNIWINDLNQSLTTIESLPVAPDKLMVGPSSSLMFVPIDVRMEDQLDHELREWLAFADQKLAEIATVTNAANRGREESGLELGVNAALLHRRSSSEAIHHPEVKQRAAAVTDDDASRGTPFTQRREEQRRRLGLPLFPTTTVGSFPQTPEVRRARRQALRNEITAEEYDRFIEEQVKHVISFQEELGLDVLVHGEFERSDMVEYFGERMKGFAFTRHGWVQSYGSRYVRPPVIFGDVSRPEPMTVRWFEYAQSLTEKPVKGMLTGPVTILNWSFVRDDQPRSETCMQIALALRDEVTDLEKAGARVIQIDEPALREGLPLREEDWAKYLDWAIAAFRVAASGVEPGTQIHTHMCYSDFNSIIDSIQAMDADVVSIENSRSDLELLDVFKRVSYANEIGPGVYDIHSPRVPSDDEMAANLEAAAGVLSVEQLWVNPDCGLKTRRWEEVEPSLKHMISAAQRLREQASVPA
jgi:5-methyltetrahydropteroyltriglutamate--homocysteine methyltransferase